MFLSKAVGDAVGVLGYEKPIRKKHARGICGRKKSLQIMNKGRGYRSCVFYGGIRRVF